MIASLQMDDRTPAGNRRLAHWRLKGYLNFLLGISPDCNLGGELTDLPFVQIRGGPLDFSVIALKSNFLAP